MTRPLRIEYDGAWYHVTCRGNERRAIYLGDTDRGRFIKVLRESSETLGVEVHCYALMSNHYHLLLHTPKGNLQRFMQRLNTAYTMYFNRKHRRCGHLLQGRYKGLLIDADNYLLELSRYIHLNPVKLKKNESLPASEKWSQLKKYKWSSYGGYVGEVKDDFVRHEMVLGYMSGEENRARKLYERFVRDGVDKDLSEIKEEVKGQILLGGESFLKWVQERFIDAKKTQEKDYSQIKELRKEITVDEIVEQVAAFFRIPTEEIRRKRSRFPEARQLAIELSYRCNGARKSLRELGRELGGIGGDAILQTHKRVQQKLNDDKRFRELLDRIEKAVRSQ